MRAATCLQAEQQRQHQPNRSSSHRAAMASTAPATVSSLSSRSWKSSAKKRGSAFSVGPSPAAAAAGQGGALGVGRMAR